MMQVKANFVGLLMLLGIPCAGVFANEFDETIKIFKEAGETVRFFDRRYGYAVFPTIGKGGAGIGDARGQGQVYEQGPYLGDTTMTQLTVGFQLGGQVYSMMIFFEDKRALDEFISGNFEFGAQATAVAITAGTSAAATATGAAAGISGGKRDAATAGAYHKGMATFTIAKGGLMYEASFGGQQFSFKPKPTGAGG